LREHQVVGFNLGKYSVKFAINLLPLNSLEPVLSCWFYRSHTVRSNGRILVPLIAVSRYIERHLSARIHVNLLIVL